MQGAMYQPPINSSTNLTLMQNTLEKSDPQLFCLRNRGTGDEGREKRVHVFT
jgi:hypothetical protein